MKIAVLIMSSDANPSLRNIDAFKDTVIKYCNDNDILQNEYEFFIYRFGEDDHIYKDDVYSNLNYIIYKGQESIYHTFEKTVLALEYVYNTYKPDVYVRLNISTYFNVRLFDKIVLDLDNNYVYCNKVNSFLNPTSSFFMDVYPRGDFMVFFEHQCMSILKHGKDLMYFGSVSTGVDHVDDCLIGVSLIKDVPDMYKCIKTFVYNYMPNKCIDTDKFDVRAISTRLKTVPPNMQSGHSWKDNEYRLFDVNKFYECHDIIEGVDYSDVKIEDVIAEVTYEGIYYKLFSVDLCGYETAKEILKN